MAHTKINSEVVLKTAQAVHKTTKASIGQLDEAHEEGCRERLQKYIDFCNSRSALYRFLSQGKFRKLVPGDLEDIKCIDCYRVGLGACDTCREYYFRKKSREENLGRLDSLIALARAAIRDGDGTVFMDTDSIDFLCLGY